MKKQISNLLFIMATAIILFSGCKNDDEVKIETLSPTAYTDSNGLSLTYSGTPMLEKQVNFTPDAQDPYKATLTLTGTAAGIIPGMSEVKLNLSDIQIENSVFSFAGTEVVNGVSIEYTGKATSTTMALDLKVTMPQHELTGKTVKLLSPALFQTTPIYINWQADDFPLGEEGSWDMQSAISMILAMAKMDDKTIPEMLVDVLSEVTFLADGNIQAKYKDSPEDAEWKTSPLNLAMYTVSNGKINVVLNMTQIAAIAGTDILPTFETALTFLASVGVDLSAGIPLAYSTEENNGINIYLDTNFILPILKAVKPLFESEAFITNIVEMLKEQAGDMAPLVEALLKPVLVAFPNVIDTTTEIELGLNTQLVN